MFGTKFLVQTWKQRKNLNRKSKLTNKVINLCEATF